MATTVDTLAEKQRKQKKILVVLGVLLLAAIALQGPKLWKQINGTPPSAVADSIEEEQDAAAAAAAAAIPGSVTPAGAPSAALVGVSVSTGTRPLPGPGQLRTFTLFQTKDPFVQSLPVETPGVESSTGAPAPADPKPAKSGANGAHGGDGAETASGSGSGGTSAPAEAAPQYATISVNNTPEPVAVKETFPSEDDVFVLVSLKAKSAKIAVAGGAFTGGSAVTLTMGKSLTLVNTATGARYVLKLLYTGSAPEEVAEFSPSSAKPEK